MSEAHDEELPSVIGEPVTPTERPSYDEFVDAVGAENMNAITRGAVEEREATQ